MEWQEVVPVKPATEALGLEISMYRQPVPLFVLQADPEFKPGLSRQYHFSSEKQSIIRNKILDSPETYYIIDPQFRLTSSTTGCTHAQ